MSLRARLGLVLTGVMIGPLVAAWVVLGVFVPRAVGDAAAQNASRSADVVAHELSRLCVAAGDAATAVSSQLLVGAGQARAVTAVAAQAAATVSAERHAGLRVVVLDRAGRTLAAEGPLAPEDAESQALLQAGQSCSRGRIDPDSPAMAERLPVQVTTTGPGATDSATVLLAEVVAWFPLDDVLVGTVVGDAGLGGEDDVLVMTVHTGDAADSRLLATTLPEGEAIALRADMDAEAGAGRAGNRRYAVRSRPDRIPLDVVGVSRGRDLGGLQVGMLTVVTVTAAGSVLLVSLLAGRLTAPLEHVAAVADRLREGDLSARTGLSGRDEVGRLAVSFDAMASELEGTVGALRDRSRALSEMFERFGEALGRSHDLNGLVRTVLDAALLGADAEVGVVLLGDVGGLQVRACQAAEGRPDPSPEVAEGLGALATRAVERREPVRAGEGEQAPCPEGLTAALALPMMKGDRVFGALGIARVDAGHGFDPDTTSALRALAGQAGTAIANVRQHEETRRQSVTDPLTGAGNFRHLSSTLAREVERAVRFGHPLAVLMLDLDHFKQVNDTLGHGFGDAVLREFARRLQECLREVDTVARYGGEEFCVIAPETDVQGACRVADRIVEVVRAEPFRVGDRSRRVTVSVGVAAHPEHGTGASEIMGAADAALYAAKRTGRDRWVLAGPTGGRRTPTR